MSQNTMTAAEQAAHTAFAAQARVITTFLEGKGLLEILSTPDIVPDELIQGQFAEIAADEEVQGEKTSPTVLGTLPMSLQALFAANGCLQDGLKALTGHYRKLEKAHAHASGMLNELFGADESPEEGGPEAATTEDTEGNPGCQAVKDAESTLMRLKSILEGRQKTFWACVRDLYPDAGNISVTADRTVVETASKTELESSMPAGLLEALLGGGLAGIMEVEIRRPGGDEEGGALPKGGPLAGLASLLGGLRRRRRSGGPN